MVRHQHTIKYSCIILCILQYLKSLHDCAYIMILLDYLNTIKFCVDIELHWVKLICSCSSRYAGFVFPTKSKLP